MSVSKLIDAEEKASRLFKEVEHRNLIASGITEKELNLKISKLAFALFGIRKYRRKQIARAGANTLLTYRENPPDVVRKDDDVVFLDFGSVFGEWEADFGRTHILGNDSEKLNLRADVESAWREGKNCTKGTQRALLVRNCISSPLS